MICLVTTIQVNDGTLLMLKKEKERANASSYDELIQNLINKNKHESYFGAFAKKKHYTREEILKDLRDKFDRI